MIDDQEIKKIAALIVLDLQNRLNEEQRLTLESFRNNSAENAAIVRRLQDKELLVTRLQQHEAIERSKAANWDRLRTQLGHRPRRQMPWRWMAAAAAVLLVIVSGTWLYMVKTPAGKPQLASDNILPGKTGATLTLANGRQIKLSDAANGEIAEETGISISKTANSQLIYTIKQNNTGINAKNTLYTAKGETYQVRLPDGTAVWLNAASSLTYNTVLDHQATRRVELSGEAYFEVSQKPTNPFVVISAGQEITVLGTSFNVNSYSNETTIKTTLLNGKVKVKTSEREVTLQPGQESVLSGTDLSVRPTDVAAATSWKNGYFSFRKTDLASIMRQLERWYNVEVEYKGKIPVRLITGNISRDASLAEALEILAYFNVHTDISGRKIIVSESTE